MRDRQVQRVMSGRLWVRTGATAAVRAAKGRIKNVRDWWIRPVNRMQQAALQAAQVTLMLRYREMVHTGAKLPTFREVGFRVFSDTDEDGILLYIFSLVGTTNRRLVDIGAASPWASNTANLIRNHAWTGLVVDASEQSVDDTRRFYEGDPDQIYPPDVVCSFVTMENVNRMLREHETTGEIDLLSIDIDGMDYWIWDAIEAVTPRVVVIEFQDILGSERAVTVPYSPRFQLRDYPVNEHSNDYVGASLPAMVKLGRRKGYRLVGANVLGFNAFFVRNDVAPDLLSEVEVKHCLSHPWNDYGARVRYPRVAEMEWVEV